MPMAASSATRANREGLEGTQRAGSGRRAFRLRRAGLQRARACPAIGVWLAGGRFGQSGGGKAPGPVMQLVGVLIEPLHHDLHELPHSDAGVLPTIPLRWALAVEGISQASQTRRPFSAAPVLRQRSIVRARLARYSAAPLLACIVQLGHGSQRP